MEVVAEYISILTTIEDSVSRNAILVGVISISILQHMIIILTIPMLSYDLQNHYS